MCGGENEHEPICEIIFWHGWSGGGGARHADGVDYIRHDDGDTRHVDGDDGARHGGDGDVWRNGRPCVPNVKEGADSLLQFRGFAAGEQQVKVSGCE